MHPACDLLDSIANGTLDPSDPTARAQAARRQAFLRALVDLGTDASPLNQLLARLVTAAHDHGVPVETRIGPRVPIPSQPALDELGVLLTKNLEAANPASPAVIMTRCEPDGGALTLVTDSASRVDAGPGTRLSTDAPTTVDGLAMTWTDLGGQRVLEVSWKVPVRNE